MAVPTFVCPTCGTAALGPAFQDHLVAHPAHREALFVDYVASHADRLVEARTCEANVFLSDWDAEERATFAAARDACGPEVVRCACQSTFCLHHSFSCALCGRFTCLRHRYSRHCPECRRGATAMPVKIEKYDPFSKERSTMMRTYARSGRIAPWERVVHDPIRRP